MPLRSLLGIIGEFRSPKPSLLAFNFTVLRSPANLSAKDLEVSLGLLPLLSLDGISEFAVRELEPQAFHSCQVSAGNVFNVSEVNKISAFGFGTRDFDQGITSKL